MTQLIVDPYFKTSEDASDFLKILKQKFIENNKLPVDIMCHDKKIASFSVVGDVVTLLSKNAK